MSLNICSHVLEGRLEQARRRLYLKIVTYINQSINVLFYPLTAYSAINDIVMEWTTPKPEFQHRTRGKQV